MMSLGARLRVVVGLSAIKRLFSAFGLLCAAMFAQAAPQGGGIRALSIALFGY